MQEILQRKKGNMTTKEKKNSNKNFQLFKQYENSEDFGKKLQDIPAHPRKNKNCRDLAKAASG